MCRHAVLWLNFNSAGFRINLKRRSEIKILEALLKIMTAVLPYMGMDVCRRFSVFVLNVSGVGRGFMAKVQSCTGFVLIFRNADSFLSIYGQQ